MEIYNYLKKLHDACLEEVEKLSFDKKHPRCLHLIGLYGSIIEFTGSLICLIEKKHRTGVPSIFRSLLEASVEFSNLHNNATYGYHMDASYQEQWLKILKEAQTKQNPYLTDMSKLPNLDELVTESETKLQDLIDKGYRPLNIFQRFDKAGMAKEYRSLYNSLSNDSHSNIRSLIDRHMEIKGKDYSVVFYKDLPIEDYLIYIDSATGLLLDTSLKVHSFFESKGLGNFKKLDDELKSIRNNYTT